MATGPNGKQRYFINGLGLGFNGMVTLESRHIKRLQGVPLYTAALIRALWLHYRAPIMRVVIDETVREEPTLALTVALGRREGNFLLAPDALTDDGLFDYLQAGALSRWELIRHVPGMITGNLPRNHPSIWMGRCRRVQVECESPLTIHLDGEMFSTPADNLRAVSVQMLPGAIKLHGKWPHG
jgi:diacylglycerol kinase family enzyme